VKKRIHVNQHVIKRNSKTGEHNPVITVKTYKSNWYAHEVVIEGGSKVIYRPELGHEYKGEQHRQPQQDNYPVFAAEDGCERTTHFSSVSVHLRRW